MGSTCGWTRGCILQYTCTCIRMFTWALHVVDRRLYITCPYMYMYKDVYMGSTCGWTGGCILHVHTCTCIRMFTWAVHVDGQEAVYYMSIHVHV